MSDARAHLAGQRCNGWISSQVAAFPGGLADFTSAPVPLAMTATRASQLIRSGANPPKNTDTPAPRRIESLDFVRGLALIVILIDHIEMVTGRQIFSRFTLRHIGLSDGLDAFVFVSGMVFGVVHGRAQNKGFLPSQMKALRRAGCLVVANTCVFAVTLLISCSIFPNPDSEGIMRIGRAIDSPLRSIVDTLTMQYQPFGFDILPMYAVILVIAPTILWVSRRNMLGAIALSTCLYMMTIAYPDATFFRCGEEPWSYQPLAWQAVFVMGMILPSFIARDWSSKTYWRTLVLTLIALFVVSLSAQWAFQILQQNQLLWLAGRSIPGVLRMAHFSLIALFVFSALNLGLARQVKKGFHWIGLMGRRSLPAFMAGLLITYWVALSGERSSAGVLLFEFQGVLIMFAASVLAPGWLR
ncbi:MAG: OpgC domain-containing protein [Planctomycetota bacterium]